MTLLSRKITIFLSVYYAHMLEYRAEIVFWMLAGLFPFILMGVWMEAGDNGTFALTAVDFGRYFVAVFIVRQMSVVWVIWEFETQVVEGRLSPFLLQPIDPVWRHVAGHISERLARAPFFILLLAGFFCFQPKLFWLPGFKQGCLALAAMVCAFILRFLIQYTFAMLCFWTERASAVQGFWFLLYLFLSGLIAPLDVFPQPMREFANWTPFPYLVNFPARLLVGLDADAGRGFLILGGWMVCFFVLNRLLWRMGLKRYSGMGA
jgi:ABC-2 type transport system permease protein